MLTLRRYRNLFEANLAKSLLDDWGVPCGILDENAHINIGIHLFIPVRLVVPSSQFNWAARILRLADTGNYDALESDFAGESPPPSDELPGTNNPWEVLAVSFLFLVPGIGFLLEHRTLMISPWHRFWGRKWLLILSPFEVHLVGCVLISIALLLVVFYLRARRAIDQDDFAESPAKSLA